MDFKDFEILSTAHRDFMLRLKESVKEWIKSVLNVSTENQDAAFMQLMGSTMGYMSELLAGAAKVNPVEALEAVMKHTQAIMQSRDGNNDEKTH